MKEFDYIIIGGGCAGLSLAYELEVYDKLKDKTLAIIEPREDYKRDKTWSFWKVFSHNFDDCVKKSWNNFTINTPDNTKYVDCEATPYQTIDSGMFYEKILSKLKINKNIQFFKSIDEIDKSNSIVFNSVPNFENKQSELWQHFCGVEIETEKDFFDDEIFNLMDFACDQRNKVHFFYTLPFTKRNALVETTWISELNNEKLKDYDIEKIAPGHGELLDNPHEVAEWIINHRLEREKKVFQALKEATRGTPDSLVERVYDDVDSSLFPIAKASLLAHLIKLEEDNLISRDGEEYFT